MDKDFVTKQWQSVAQELSDFKVKNGQFVVQYVGLTERFDAATERLKDVVLESGEQINDRFGTFTIEKKVSRKADAKLLETLLPAGLVDEIIESKVSLKRLDDAVARGEVDGKKVSQAITTEEINYVKAKLTI